MDNAAIVGDRASGRAAKAAFAGDWTEQACNCCPEGITAVKISRLCKELGVTKGSFYWHFDDIDELMKTIATTASRRTTPPAA